jgi:spermidine synthase
MIDVDSKNMSTGLSCPPPAFVSLDFFRQIHSSLHPGGLFLLNLVCRAKQLFQDIVADAKSVFAKVHQLPVPGDVNVVLICVARESETEVVNHEDEKSAAADDSKTSVESSSTVVIQPSAAVVKSLMVPSMASSVDLEKLISAVILDEPNSSTSTSEATAAVASSSKKKNKKKK